MTHTRYLARAGALAAFLGASLFWQPALANPNDEAMSLATAEDGTGTTLSPPPLATEEGTLEPSATSLDTPSPSSTLDGAATDPASLTPTATTIEPALTPTETLEPPTATSSPELSPTEAETSTPPGDPPTVEGTASAMAPSGTPSETPSSTSEGSASLTPTSSPTLTPSGTADPVIGAAAAAFAPGAILINEVAWAGTEASANDEWIELWNPGSDPILLDGWRLTDGGDIDRMLMGSIAAYSFYLLERTDDATVADVAADLIYTGSLANGGEALALVDPTGVLIDTANSPGGPWPAGDTSPRAAMERHGALDVPASWATFAGIAFAYDADGGPVFGTPRQPNSPSSPTTTPTPTPSPTSEPAATPFPPGTLHINEVAWSGTGASASDEWIELHNPGPETIDLGGWTLSDGGDIDVSLGGRLDAGDYFLLERTDDSTVGDVGADQVYAGGLSNSGEFLVLLDPSGAEIDVVNLNGGAWPAGNASTHASMERTSAGGWATFTGFYGVGRDAAGNPIAGTPRALNSVLFPAPTATWIPGRIVINEVLMRPRHDWQGTGGVTTDDEFIELYNRGPGAVNLRGWTLDDYVVGGSAPYTLPPIRLEAGEFLVLFRSKTRLALNDSGDQVRLSDPDGRPVDKVRFLGPSAANLSYGRLPDGDDVLVYGLWPTPGEKNILFVEPRPIPYPVGAMLISEVAWAGTLASANDEWIELYNPGSRAISLEGWRLSDGSDLAADLHGEILPGGYFLLERTDDATVADVPADQVYTGGLANTGERLALVDPSGAEIDVVNPEGAAWPAGSESSRASMERTGAGAWSTFVGESRVAHDSAGEPIAGSPRAPNRATDGDAGCPPGLALGVSCR